MIHQNVIKRRADDDDLSAPTVERDYVLAHSLAAIADHEPKWEERWDKELIEYTTSPPQFDGVLRAVRRELRFALVG